MSDIKKVLRKMAADRNGPIQMLRVLNDPLKVLAIPTSYRDRVLADYGVPLDHLVGEAPINVVFVREGLAIQIVHTDENGKQHLIVHGIDLRPGQDQNIEELGSEIYSFWQSFPQEKLLSYSQLQNNWKIMLDAAALAS
jgi:hypothetical protein